MLVGRAVVKKQFHLGHGRQDILLSPFGAREVEHLLLGEGEIDVHLVVVRDGEERCRGIDQCPDAVGGHAGIGEVVFGIDQLGLCLCQRCLCTVQVVDSGLQVEVRDDVFPPQFLLALSGHLCRGHCRFRAPHIGTGRCYLRLIGHLVNDKQRLPFLHGGTLVNTNFRQQPRHLGVDAHVLLALDGSGILALQRLVCQTEGQCLVPAPYRCCRFFLATRRKQQGESTQPCPNNLFTFTHVTHLVFIFLFC